MKPYRLFQSEQDPETFFICREDGTCKEFESGSLRWLVEDLEHTLPVESGGHPSASGNSASFRPRDAEQAPTLSGQGGKNE